MAQRRMISLRIVDTDAFLAMPMSTRCLYYDLTLRADDDGFVSSPKKIQRIVGCSDDDFHLLMQKEYIIPFNSGVCVIKDWNVHNYIRKDRYNKTIYLNELKDLYVDENGRYQEKIEEIKSVIPDVIPLVDTGKVRLGKYIYITTTKGITKNKGCQVDKSVDNIKINGINLLVEKYGKGVVDEKLSLLSVQKNVRNPVAWLRKALEEDWKKENHVALDFGKVPNLDCKKCNGTGYETRIEMLTEKEIIVKCDCCR